MRVGLVTGASSGIGLATVVALAREGFTVVATMRDTSRSAPLEEAARAAGVEVDVQPLEVTDPASVQACVDGAIARHGGIDLLVNNAGAGLVGSLEQTTLDDARRAMDVNFFGVWHTTRAVLPSMRAKGSGRVISVSSVGGIVGQPFNDAYCAAKFAVEGFMESLLPVVRAFGIFVSIVEPGPVNTSFVAAVAPAAGRLVADESDPYGGLLRSYLDASREVFASRGQTGDEVAAVILEAATAAAPHFRYQTSEVARQLAVAKFADPDGDSIIKINGARLTGAGPA